MTSPEVSGPFGTSPWSEESWFKFAGLWSPSGVIGDVATSAGSGPCAFSSAGLTATVGAGNLWVNGAGYEMPGKSRTVTPNTHSSWSRRDRLVARMNIGAGNVDVVWLPGTPAQFPAAPALTRTAGVWDLPLHSFLVPPASGTALSDVADERGWVDSNRPIAFLTARARDAYFPAAVLKDGGQIVRLPVDGTRCWLAGVGEQVFSAAGGGWLYVTGGSVPKTRVPDNAGWWFSVAGESPMQFWRDDQGMVHVNGHMRNRVQYKPSFETIPFVLPPGFRPAGFFMFPIPVSLDSPIFVGGHVTVNGEIAVPRGPQVIAGAMHAIGISFPADH